TLPRRDFGADRRDGRAAGPSPGLTATADSRISSPRCPPLGSAGFQKSAERGPPPSTAPDSYSVAARPAAGTQAGAVTAKTVCIDDSRTPLRRNAAAARPHTVPAHRR